MELECNLYGTEIHSIRSWKKCGIKVELTFRRINSILWNSLDPSFSGIDGPFYKAYTNSFRHELHLPSH